MNENSKDRKRSMNVVNVTTMNDVIATKIAAVAIVEDIVAVLDRLTAHDMIGAIGAIGVIAEIGIVAVEETTITVVKKIEGIMTVNLPDDHF